MQNIPTSGLFWAKKSVLSWQIIEFLNDLLEFFKNLLDFFSAWVFLALSFFRNVQKMDPRSQMWPYCTCRSYDSRSSGRSLRSRSRSPRGGSRERREKEATHDAMVLEARARIHQMMGGSSSGVSSDTSQDLYAGQLFKFYYQLWFIVTSSAIDKNSN